jgi:hypothetical protein
MDENYLITDSRNSSNFKLKTFSGYKKKDVINALINSIDNVNVENICNWITECIISGYTIDIFDKLLLYSSNNININNSRLPHLLLNKSLELNNFITLNRISNNDDILTLRNVQYIRNLLIYISILLAISIKNKKQPKIPSIKTNEFDINNIKHNFKSDKYLLSDNFIKFNEPSELKIIINELHYNLKQRNGYNKSIYWISWILQWEKYSKKYNTWFIENREISNIKDKYKSDVIWIIWNIIMVESNVRNDEINLQIKSLFNLYKLNYTVGKKNTRLPYLYNSVMYLTNEIDVKIPLISNMDIIIKSQLLANNFYKYKKNYEVNEYNNNIKDVSVQSNTKKKKKKQEKLITEKEKCINQLDIFNNLDPII